MSAKAIKKIGLGLSLWMLTCVAVAHADAQATQDFAPVAVEVQEDQDANADGRGDRGQIVRMPKDADAMTTRTFTFEGVAQNYQLRFTQWSKADKQLGVQFGSVEPQAGWYGYKTVDIALGGKSMWDGKLTVQAITTPQPAVQITSEHDAGKVTLTFSMLRNDDKLLGKVTIEPKDPRAGGMLMLWCYPGEFARAAEDRARYIVTPSKQIARSEISADQWVELSPEDRWLMMGDSTYSPENSKGIGPSAVAWEKAGKASVLLTSYVLQPRIVFTQKTFHFMLWEMPRRSREDALTYLKALNIDKQ